MSSRSRAKLPPEKTCDYAEFDQVAIRLSALGSENDAYGPPKKYEHRRGGSRSYQVDGDYGLFPGALLWSVMNP